MRRGRELIPPGCRQNRDGLHDLSVIRQRFTHPHKDDIGHGFMLGPSVLDLPDLADDFPGGQVTHGPDLGGRAKLTAHGTADLGRNTQRPAVLTRNKNALNPASIDKGKEIFFRSISRGGVPATVQTGKLEMPGQLLAQGLGHIAHLPHVREPVLMHPFQDLLRPEGFMSARSQPAGEFVLGTIFKVHTDQTGREVRGPDLKKRLRPGPAH